jgi:hypothetical protein
MTTFKTHLFTLAVAFCATVVHAQRSGSPAEAVGRVASILAGDPNSKKDNAAHSAIQRIELGTPRVIFAPDGSISKIHSQGAVPPKRRDNARTIREPGAPLPPAAPGNHIERTTPEPDTGTRNPERGGSSPLTRPQLQRHVAYYDEPKNTAIKEEGYMLDQKPVRDWKLYHQNGKVEQEGSYDMRGLKQGDWKIYSSDGTLKETQSYVDGKLTDPPAETTPTPGN